MGEVVEKIHQALHVDRGWLMWGDPIVGWSPDFEDSLPRNFAIA